MASFQMPALLPKELLYGEKATSDDSLLEMLTKKTQDLVTFFEYASGDETWSELHTEFMHKAMEWFTSQAFEDKLYYAWTKQIGKAIQEHYSILKPVIPLNISFKLKDTTVQINSLLFTAASSFFKDILGRECRDKNKTTLNLDVPMRLFQPIEEFVNTGMIAQLWKSDQTEVIALLRLANSWGLDQVVTLCEESLQRYITQENAVEMLLMAHQELWPRFKQICNDYLNNLEGGFRLLPSPTEQFYFEFLEFNETSLEYFERFRAQITELICTGPLIEDPHFNQVVQRCPKLRSLNISASTAFTEHLLSIPKDLQSLILSQCPWLNHQTLKKMSEICPYLKKIVLASNIQLNFVAWGELVKFRNLTTLDLSRCHHITDNDFLVILKACYGVNELILDECKKISDKGYFRLAKTMPRLTTLNLSRCSITDLALIEIATRCYQLSSLNLMRCENITEKGIMGLTKHAHSLTELTLTRTNIPSTTIEELKKIKPYLTVI